jgi:hypothetical protein
LGATQQIASISSDRDQKIKRMKTRSRALGGRRRTRPPPAQGGGGAELAESAVPGQQKARAPDHKRLR